MFQVLDDENNLDRKTVLHAQVLRGQETERGEARPSYSQGVLVGIGGREFVHLFRNSVHEVPCHETQATTSSLYTHMRSLPGERSWAPPP